MFSLTMATMPSAASSTLASPIASAIFCIAARAAPTSSVISPPSRLGGRCPSTTFASVTVGSSPPLPYAAGPGSAPADCGPTRSAFVSCGTCPIEPPPAPTVCTLTDGTLIRNWPIDVSRPIVGWPFWQRATSVEVPPMSNVRMSSKPARRATKRAPATPPEGPESTP